jgi:hypothetical protein
LLSRAAADVFGLLAVISPARDCQHVSDFGLALGLWQKNQQWCTRVKHLLDGPVFLAISCVSERKREPDWSKVEARDCGLECSFRFTPEADSRQKASLPPPRGFLFRSADHRH